jgi:hypothetical protein
MEPRFGGLMSPSHQVGSLGLEPGQRLRVRRETWLGPFVLSLACQQATAWTQKASRGPGGIYVPIEQPLDGFDSRLVVLLGLV